MNFQDLPIWRSRYIYSFYSPIHDSLTHFFYWPNLSVRSALWNLHTKRHTTSVQKFESSSKCICIYSSHTSTISIWQFLIALYSQHHRIHRHIAFFSIRSTSYYSYEVRGQVNMVSVSLSLNSFISLAGIEFGRRGLGIGDICVFVEFRSN